MATFGEFAVARLGMIASQMALNVTGQNISNINTNGYTRQMLDQYSFITNTSGMYHSNSSAVVGSGVLLAGVSQLRDPYLDIRFRKEMAGVGATDATLNGLDQIGSIINTVNKESIQTAFQELFDRISAYSADRIGEEEFDTLVRSAAEELCTLLNTTADKLQTVFDNVKQQYEEEVANANDILERIQKINEQIRIADVNGDSALELRDQRNLLLDELSQYMKIDVTYGKENIGAGVEIEKLTIKMVDAETGKPTTTLIDGLSRAEISIGDTDGMFLNIGELFDIDGNQVSNTTSKFQMSGLKFGENAVDGDQTVTLTLRRPDGSTTDVPITFYADPDDQPGTIQNFLAALDNDPRISTNFTVEATGNGLSLISKGTGTVAYEIDSITLPDSISFSSTKNTPAVASNVNELEEGESYGSLESYRQMLTGAGEFRTDGGDTSIRGITYYMKSLDAMANKFAAEMNRVNTTRPDGSDFSTASGNYEAIDTAGYLFTAEGDAGDPPTQTITAANITVSAGWQNGTVNLVPSVTPDLSSANDNISRFENILNASYTYSPFETVRDGDTIFNSGTLTQTGGAGQPLQVQITYLDSMNREQTVTIDFTSGADENATMTNLWNAINNNPALTNIGFDTFGNQGGKITIGDANGIPEGSLNNIVTDIAILDNTGEPSTDFTLSEGTISGDASTDQIFSGNFEGFYANMEGVWGADMSTTNSIYTTYATSADTLNSSRDGVSGVDLNDEGINLLQYQKAFSAACRLMTALDEAMDKVINGMGVVGR